MKKVDDLDDQNPLTGGMADGFDGLLTNHACYMSAGASPAVPPVTSTQPASTAISRPAVVGEWIVRNAQRPMTALAMIAFVILQGCSSPPAPSPTPNPHPVHTQKLKISVGKWAEVNRVEVESIWVVGDLSCAPVVWPSGSTKVKQVHVPEEVEKVGDDYIATLVLDRFLPGRCHWVGGGYGIRFYHDKSLLGVRGGELETFRENGGKFEGVCVPPWRPKGPAVCSSRDAKHDQFLRSHLKNVFNETEELMP